ncbi:MAG: LysR family transcriptional regulator [Cyclobacteriaceae bacterium]
MNITFHQLRILLKVAELQSVTKAAEELYLTQPAISIQLKKLQDQFELPLTEIVGRQLYVTDFGYEIVKRSRRILDEADGIKYLIDQYKGLISGKIRISVVSTAKYVIPYFLKPFMDKYPGVEISLDVSNKNKVIEGMIRNESDFSLVSVLPKGMRVNALELMENKLTLVSSSKHPFHPKKPKDLEKVTLLFREKGSATRNAMEEYLKKHNVQTKNSMELVSNEAVKQAVNAGIGFSIMPLIGLRNQIKIGSMKTHNMKGLPIITRWNLIYNEGKQLTPAQSALLDFIKESKSQIMEEYFTDVF